MKEWFKNKLRKWFFQKEDEETAQASLHAAGQVLRQEKEVQNSNAFLAEQLMSAEKDLLLLKRRFKESEEEKENLENRLEEIASRRQRKLDLPADFPDFYKNCSRRYENITVYEEENPDMKIKYNIVDKINGGAVPPTRTGKSDPGHSLFLPDHGNTTLAPGESMRLGLGYSLKIPKGYVGKIISLPNMLNESTICVVDSVICPEDDNEVAVTLMNWHPTRPIIVNGGHRVALLVIDKAVPVEFEDGKDPGSIVMNKKNPMLGQQVLRDNL